ncbi:MAG: outer membrane protein assembly factor BamD [Candidatus Puniceispirillaceae bacterium]
MHHFIKLSLLAIIAGWLAGCSSSNELDQLVQQEKPVDVLYNEALNTALSDGPKAAAPKFEEVERQHPYSKWATQAQVMAAWSFYQDNQYSRALSALDRFIELNPAAGELTEYAYYLRALCFYEQIVDVGRDAAMTIDAKAAFEELLRRYPDGLYARDAQLKLDLTRSHLAGKEMAVGRFYLDEGHFGAAINRFEIVVRDFDTTNQAPEALYRMIEAYLSLGLTDEAMRVLQVSDYNYADSIWTARARDLLDDPSRPAPQGLVEGLITKTFSIFE